MPKLLNTPTRTYTEASMAACTFRMLCHAFGNDLGTFFPETPDQAGPCPQQSELWQPELSVCHADGNESKRALSTATLIVVRQPACVHHKVSMAAAVLCVLCCADWTCGLLPETSI